MNNSKFDFTKVTTKNYKELYHANGNLYYLDETFAADGRYWIVDGFTEEEVKNAIINGVNIIFIEGAPKNPFVLEKQPENARIAYGHSIDEYYDIFGEAYQEGEYWDFSKEDFERGAIDVDPDKVYWYIKDKTGEWRYFETNNEYYTKLSLEKQAEAIKRGANKIEDDPELLKQAVYLGKDGKYHDIKK